MKQHNNIEKLKITCWLWKRMRVINGYSLPTAMLTTQWDSNVMYKMQRIIEHKSSKRVKAYKIH